MLRCTIQYLGFPPPVVKMFLLQRNKKIDRSFLPIANLG
jgi:hypothetical protein